MTLKLDIISLLNMVGITNGLLGALVLFRLPKGRRSNLLLATMLIAFALLSLTALLHHNNLSPTPDSPLYNMAPLLFILGPTFFFYLSILTNHQQKWRLKSLLHIIPTHIVLILTVLIARMNSGFMPRLMTDYSRISPFLVLLALVHFSTYVVMGWNIMQKAEQRIMTRYANFPSSTFKWLSTLALMNFTIIALKVLPFDTLTTLSPLLGCWEALMVNLLLYKGMIQPELMLVEIVSEDPIDNGDIRDQLLWIRRLDKLMRQDKLYRDPELNIDKLASISGLKTEQVSIAINRRRGINFFQYVNEFRIEAVKRQLIEKRKEETILDIALAVGFNSKSSFNSVFKSFTGQTPSDFIHQTNQS